MARWPITITPTNFCSLTRSWCATCSKGSWAEIGSRPSTEEIASLIREPPKGLERYCPNLRYLLLDEGGYDDTDLSRNRNLAAMLFRPENCRRRDRIKELIGTVLDWLKSSEHASLRRAFIIWLQKVILTRFHEVRANTAVQLWESETMLSEQVPIWEEELRQEGEVKLLLRQLQKRFGELPESIRAVLKSAQTDRLEHWGVRLFDVTSLDELFSEG